MLLIDELMVEILPPPPTTFSLLRRRSGYVLATCSCTVILVQWADPLVDSMVVQWADPLVDSMVVPWADPLLLARTTKKNSSDYRTNRK
jgi:hypothetical protein